MELKNRGAGEAVIKRSPETEQDRSCDNYRSCEEFTQDSDHLKTDIEDLGQ